MVDKIAVDLIVKAIAEGFDTVTGEMGKISDAGDELGESVGSSGLQFTELASKIAVAQQAAQLFFGVFQKAFELGKVGAEVAQTAESFDMLIKKVGGSADLLAELRTASGNTISDMKLQSATATLLAGAHGELGTALASSTPELMKIAKAAQKLNPALGDTAHMYNSIATGIKRASPMILDNLGLTIKIGKANEDYAASLGKTVDELSAEEKQLALLNATLEAGNVLIDQVGGNTESATDSILRMETAFENISNTAAAEFAPAMADVADSIYIAISAMGQIKSSLQSHVSQMATSAKSWREYSTEIERSVTVSGYIYKEVDGHIQILQQQGSVVRDVTSEFNLMTKNLYEVADAAEEAASFDRHLAEATKMVMTEAEKAEQAIIAEKNAMERAAQAADALAIAHLAILEAGLAAGLKGDMQDAIDSYANSMQTLMDNQADLSTELDELYKEGFGAGSEEILKVTGALDENIEAQQRAAEALRETTNEMIYQQAAAGLDAEAALGLARSMGLLSEQDYAVAASIQAMRSEFDLNADAQITAAEGAAQYATQIDMLGQAVANLQAVGAEVTFENLANELAKISAAQAGDENIADVGKAAEGAAGSVDDMADKTETAIGNIADMGGESIDTKADVEELAVGVDELTKAIEAVPDEIRLKVTETGLGKVTGMIDKLKKGINTLPSNTTVTINVQTNTSESLTDAAQAAGMQ